MRISACRSCSAPILWVEMPSGKMNPLDVYPQPTGDWAIDDRSTPPKAGRIVRDPNAAEPVLGYVSHFATCPNAKTHRVKR